MIVRCIDALFQTDVLVKGRDTKSATNATTATSFPASIKDSARRGLRSFHSRRSATAALRIDRSNAICRSDFRAGKRTYSKHGRDHCLNRRRRSYCACCNPFAVGAEPSGECHLIVAIQNTDVCCWHETDLPRCPQFGSYRGESGHGGYDRRLPSLTHLRHWPPILL
jgi:hypothetical protein